jgi:hypothetical protein
MNDSTQLNGRQIFVWRGLDPDDDTNRLIEAIAEKAITRLFNLDGGLVLFSDGQTIPVTRVILHEIITKIIAGVRLVAHAGTLKLEYFSFDFPISGDLTKGPNDRTLADITDRLLTLVAKGPSTPRRLSEQHEREARARLKTGEPASRIADAYSVGIDTIRQLAR